jgi:CheY-like chemotaxis protein
MDAETRSRVFEPFFTTKDVGKGTGLGLSTVYGIIKQNGGMILVDSEPGHGTSFRIYLPRAAEAVTVEPVARATPQPAAGENRVVLVVEDEDAVRGLVCRTLRRYGYRILEAADGPAALEICSHHPAPIHLLLSDMIMPGMSGKDVAERITAMRRETSVLFMSGHTRDVLGSRGMLDESTDLIQKPFAPRDLARRVREALSA